jgi:glycosyltransferase involved in cell wall biosynthesis
MRILKVTASYAPFLEHGGPPVKVRALAEGLAQRGHSITVLTVDWGLAAHTGDLAPGASLERTPFGWSRTENGVEAVYLPTRMRYRTVTWNPAAAEFCRARLAAYDAVHIYGLYDLLGPRVAAACRALGVPYVVEPIGMYAPIVRSLWLKRMYHRLIGHQMILGARAVIATSEQEASELASGGVSPECVVLRRNGVSAPALLPPRGTFRFENGIPANARLILFLGRLVSKKSPDLLLRAFASLPAQTAQSGLRLIFAGPDEEGMTSQLRALAHELRVATRVHFTGPLFGNAKWAAYRDAHVFVLPSQNENFGNTAAEAIAAGTPVILTETCGIAPLLADEAGLVVPHDAAALAAALQRVLSDAALHQRLANGCATVLPRLGWAEPLAQMETLYARLAPDAERVAESRDAE